MTYKSIGWIPTENGAAYQSTVSNAYNHMFDKKNRKPTRKSVQKVYGTEGRAKGYSPDGTAEEVFIVI